MYKVLIRPLEINDAEISWKWRNNPEIWELTGSRPKEEITFETERRWIEKVIKDDSSRRFAILVDDIYVGNIQLTNIQNREFAEYHIFIGDSNYWNKGIAKLASLQIIRYAKNVLGLKKIILFVNPNHTNAIKLYQSCNFRLVSDEIKMELELENSPIPMVSIFVMVYNHEKFIPDAIDSFLMQKCTFDFDIVIGEDCSKDRSREILMHYQNKFPGKFKLLLHNNNIGAQKNQIEVLANCTGKHIAFCEGDDYWIDPLKLQKQVDFLEANPEFIITYHDAKIIDSSGSTLFENMLAERNKKDFSSLELKKGPHILTLSIMYRNVIKEFPPEMSMVFNGDTFLFSLLGNYGMGKYLPNIENAAYRKHNTGVWTSVTKENRMLHFVNTYLNLVAFYKRNDDYEIQYYFNKKISGFYKMLVLFYFKKLRFIESFSYGIKLIKILIHIRKKHK